VPGKPLQAPQQELPTEVFSQRFFHKEREYQAPFLSLLLACRGLSDASLVAACAATTSQAHRIRMCRIWWNVRLEFSQLQPHLLHHRPAQANPNQQWQDYQK